MAKICPFSPVVNALW